jgi:3'(2'), 5'-bisphosphate nucleotidase
VQDKVPVLGVVHVPVTGQTYYAVKGKGAFIRAADGSTRQIHCKEFAIGQPNLVVVGSASHANPSNNKSECVTRPTRCHKLPWL